MANSRTSSVQYFGKALPSFGSDRVAVVFSSLAIVVSVGFFCIVTAIASNNPGYFDRLLVTAMQRDIDPIETGSTQKADADGIVPLPVPAVVRTESLTPADFQIVMVYGGEAHLSSPGELWRVRVGTIVPGLGKILSIEPSETGGIVEAEQATLKGVRITR